MIPTQLIQSMPADFFGQVVSACPRRSRETLFTRFAIPKPKKTASALLPSKDPARIGKLQVAMSGLAEDDEQGQQLAEELLRVYLMGKRELLGAALDAIEVDHQDGLTDDDLDGFAELSPEDAVELAQELSQAHNPLDVSLYLRFMGADLGAE
jgi:hypothetical protein